MSDTTIQSDNRDPAGDALSAAKDRISKDLSAFVAGVPERLRQDATELAAYAGTAIKIAEHHAAAIERAYADLDAHPDGRQARAKAQREQAELDLNSTASGAEARLNIFEAQLLVAAFPKITSHEAATLARMDAQAIIDGAKDKASAFEMLASDPDPAIRSLMQGDWGRRQAKVHGISDKMLSAYRTFAIEVEQHSDGSRGEAARSLKALGGIRSINGGSQSLARSILNKRG